MAATGMRFTDFYSQPVCGPARAALMTGCYPIRVAERRKRKHFMPILHEREPTLGSMLQECGYATAHIGKLAAMREALGENLPLSTIDRQTGKNL
jgi:arylsulfatase A-like enzyme